MASRDSENPFRSPDHQTSKYSVRSDPSIEFEPHMRPSEETLDSSDQNSVWREPALGGEGFLGVGDESRRRSHGWLRYLAVLLLLGLICTLLVWIASQVLF